MSNPHLTVLNKNEHGWILTYSITKFCFENEAFYMADDCHSDLKKLMMSMCKFWLPDYKSGVREILGSCQNGHVDTGFFFKITIHRKNDFVFSKQDRLTNN